MLWMIHAFMQHMSRFYSMDCGIRSRLLPTSTVPHFLVHSDVNNLTLVNVMTTKSCATQKTLIEGVGNEVKVTNESIAGWPIKEV